MKTTVSRLRSLEQTINVMRRLAVQHAGDLAPYATWPLSRIYNLVRALPYVRDPAGNELVKRPYYTLNGIGDGGDCDDKTVVLLAWAKLNGVPARIVVSGKSAKKPLHHVYPEVYINSEWVPVDATYSYNSLGRRLFKEEKRKVFSFE